VETVFGGSGIRWKQREREVPETRNEVQVKREKKTSQKWCGGLACFQVARGFETAADQRTAVDAVGAAGEPVRLPVLALARPAAVVDVRTAGAALLSRPAAQGGAPVALPGRRQRRGRFRFLPHGQPISVSFFFWFLINPLFFQLSIQPKK